MAKKIPDIATYAEMMAAGDEFQRDVNTVLTEQFGGDVSSPEWAAWWDEMNAWIEAAGS